MIAVLLSGLAAVLLAAGLRFGAGGAHLAPWPVTPNFWAMGTGVVTGLAFLAIRRRGLALDELGWRVPVAWAIWVVVPTVVWSIGDQVVEQGSELIWLVAAGVLAAFTLGIDRRRWVDQVLRGRRSSTAATSMVFALGGLAWLLLRQRHGGPEPPTSGAEWRVVLATYPLYAVGQLLVFLVLPVVLAQREGLRRSTTVLVCATIFALAHWPNPVLVLLTGVAMAAWAWLYLRGAALWSIALSMGWLGALFAQGLAPSAVGHMRVGPGYVLRMQQLDHLATFDARVRFLASEESFTACGAKLEPWLRWMHLEVFGDPIGETVLQGWRERIETGVRSRVVRTFYESSEFAGLHGPQPALDGRDRRLLAPRFRPRGQAQADYDELCSERTYDAVGRDFRAFLTLLYRRLLSRQAAESELEAWPEAPTRDERAEVARMFLRSGPERGFYIFERDDTPFWWPSSTAGTSN